MSTQAVTTEVASIEKIGIQEKYRGYPVHLSKRPKRQHVINRDDIINLKIALETSKTLKEFLSKV